MVLIKTLGWSYAGPSSAAMDHETGKLIDVLNCPWDVIAVVALSELAGDLLAGLIAMCMSKWAPPELLVVAPRVTPSHWALVILMWLNIGGFYMNGIASMGEALSDSLHQQSLE